MSTDSIWANDLMTNDDANNFYLRIKDGDKLTLKWLDIVKQQQSENTPELYKTPDGVELMATFELDGVKRGFTCKSAKNKLLVAMKNAGIELGDTFTVSRTGAGAEDTTYTVNKLQDGLEIVPVAEEVVPF